MDKYKVFIDRKENLVYAKRLMSENTKEYYDLIKKESNSSVQQLIIVPDVLESLAAMYMNKGYDLLIKYKTTSLNGIEQTIEEFFTSENIPNFTGQLFDELEVFSITLTQFEEKFEIMINGVIYSNVPLSSKLLKKIYSESIVNSLIQNL